MKTNVASKKSLKNEQFDSKHRKWSCKLGAQVGSVSFRLLGDILENTTSDEKKQLQASILGNVTEIASAVRLGNYRPVNIPSTMAHDTEQTLMDFQFCVGDLNLYENVHFDLKPSKTRFGCFSKLSDQALLRVLMCLGVSDLISAAEAFRIASDLAVKPQQSPMAVWHVTNNIVKVFRDFQVEKEPKGLSELSLPRDQMIPIVLSWNSVAPETPVRSMPLLSLFFRNYNDVGHPCRIVAGSLDSLDITLTTSSLYCITSLADVINTVKDVPQSPLIPPDEELTTSESMHLSPRADKTANPWNDVHVSIAMGQLRLILPNENLLQMIASGQISKLATAYFVIESASISSTVWNEIRLDGLGYPPFNATMLPRQPKGQMNRFGNGDLRIGCRLGKMYGMIAGIEPLNQTPNAPSLTGPFEQVILKAGLHPHTTCAPITFMSPFNVSLNALDTVPKIKSRITMSLTKLRVELSKEHFDLISMRIFGIINAASELSKLMSSRTTINAAKKHVPEENELQTHGFVSELTWDGIEMAISSPTASIHLRVGTINLSHDASDRSGGCSIQNAVVGFRPSSALEASPIEEVVFGAFGDPALWQFGVEDYPEKLISGRWSFAKPSQKESTLFLDIQAYQLHLSGHFLESLATILRYSHTPTFMCRDLAWNQNRTISVRQEYIFVKKGTVKILIAPSVISFWERNDSELFSTNIWIPFGQLFASIGFGYDEAEVLQVLNEFGGEVHALNRYVNVRALEFMLNAEKIGIKSSTQAPVLQSSLRNERFGTISSTWPVFSNFLTAESAKRQVVEDFSIRLTGDQQFVLERRRIGQFTKCLPTSLTHLNVQGELTNVGVKISSYSLEAVLALIEKVRRRQSHRSDSNLGVADHEPDSTNLKSSKLHSEISPDDFAHLHRMAEASHPSPGELVFTETLLIETIGSLSDSTPNTTASTVCEVDNDQVSHEELVSFILEANSVWFSEEQERPTGLSDTQMTENVTHSWMMMRWCYHLPRAIQEIVSNPVPLPPSGIPNGWPIWYDAEDINQDQGRICDILCQLRCWDYKKARFIVVGEFYVPWERSTQRKAPNEYELGSFGDLVSQWFEGDMDDDLHQSHLLEFASVSRTTTFEDLLPSDKWELRWRSPLCSEKESEVSIAMPQW